MFNVLAVSNGVGVVSSASNNRGPASSSRRAAARAIS